jgi:signal transduction histidine kinase
MSEVLAKDIINLLQFPIYWKDIHGKYLGCNTFLTTIAGFNKTHHLIGKSDNELVWSQYAEKIQYVDEQVIASNKVMIIQEQIISASGQVLNFLSIKSPLKNKYAQIIGIIGVSLNLHEQDFTNFDSKALQNMLHMNQIIAMRQIKHDIKGPLGALTSFCEHIVNAKDDPVKVVYLSQLLFKFCNAMDDFMQSLTLSCISDDSKANKILFTLNDLLSKVYNLAKPIAYSKNLELHYDTQIDDKYQIYAAKDIIFRIIMELTNNAIKHSKKGKIVTIKSYLDNSCAHIQISNTGTVISQEVIDLMLSPHTIVDENALTQGHGFGLGMVNTLAKLINTDLKVISDKNSGTIITLSIKNE